MIRDILESLRVVLEEGGDFHSCGLVTTALDGEDEQIEAFVTSNELWGGSGSIADQACLSNGSRTDDRRAVEKVLIRLGDEQARLEKVNSRTEFWVKAFKQWNEESI